MADAIAKSKKRSRPVDESENDGNSSNTNPPKKRAQKEVDPASRKAEFDKKYEDGLVKVTNIYKQNANQTLQSATMLKRFAGLVKKLHVTYSEKHHRFDKELEDAIVEHCQQSLVEVEFVNFDASMFTKFKSSFPNVRKVCFKSGVLNKFIAGFNKWFPNARHLDLIELKILKSPDAKRIEQSFPAVEHLGVVNLRQADEDFDYKYQSAKELAKIRKINIFTSQHLNSAIPLNPQLKSLELKHTNDDRRGYYVDDSDGIKISPEFLQFLNDNLSTLESLKLTITQLNFDHDEETVHFKNLKHLTMCFESSYTLDSYSITSDDLEVLTLIGELDTECTKFVSRNTNIRKLELIGLWKSNLLVQMLPVLSTCPKLSEMRMSINGLTIDNIISLLNECKSLTKIYIIQQNQKGVPESLQEIFAKLQSVFEKNYEGSEWKLQVDDKEVFFVKEEVA